MKEAITGYITGVINRYTRSIERLKKCGAPATATNNLVLIKEEFSDLLEFVINIPDDSQTLMLNFNAVLEDKEYEITILKQRAAELEESCENIYEVERNLHKKIERLEAAEISYREQFLDDKQKIEEVEKEKNEFWECNKQLNELYKEKRSKNEILQTQNKKLKYDNKKLHKKIELLRKKSNGTIKKNV